MSGAATQEGIDYLLNLMRGGEQVVSSYFVALIGTVPPGFTIGGEELDEPDEPEYLRGEIVNDSGSWDITEGLMVNTIEITFTTALSDWGQINYWAICDQPLEFGGRVLFCGEFDEPLFVTEGDQVFLGPGELGLDMSGEQWQTMP